MSNSKTCPVCETPNELGAKHCEVCGEPLPIPQSGAAPSAPEAAAPAASGGFSYEADPVDGNPSQPDARVAIEAAQPGSADAIAATVPTSFDSEPSGPRGGDLSALDKFDEMLAAPSDAVAPTPAPAPTELPKSAPNSGATRGGFEREQHDTIVDHPAIPREAPSPVGATAHLVVYVDRQPVHTHDVVHDETLIGRYDPTSNAYPQLDMTPYDPDSLVSRKHCSVLREGGKYFVRPLSGAGTQINNHLVELGARMEIEEGDVLILGGAIAMKFSLD